MANFRTVTRTLPEEFVLCRSMSHSWDTFNPITDKRPPAGHWLLALMCERCKTERFDTIDRHGRLVSRSYNYLDSYREAGVGTKGFPRDEFRRELALRRLGRLRR